ncbi:MAG: TIGR04282 family arsenosugar biosynthesis glycosyltransferase [Candidatus Obscuribacterales bacterium]
MSLPETALVAFAKNPDIVPVKTRLATTFGADRARLIYIAMLEDCLTALSCLPGQNTVCTRLYLACYPDEKGEFFQPLARHFELSLIPQTGADLGERMTSCLETLLAEHETVFIFGTDIPRIPVASLGALLKRTDFDIALGPSPDGGYYALGARKEINPGIFQGVSWSSGGVLEQTLVNCRALDLAVAFLDDCQDVDDRGSLEALIGELRKDHEAAPATRAVLGNMGFFT